MRWYDSLKKTQVGQLLCSITYRSLQDRLDSSISCLCSGDLTLVCIGPLTNVALAVRLDPNFLDNLQDIYILGGAAHGEQCYT